MISLTLAEGSNGDLYIGHTYNGFTIFSPDNNSFKNFTIHLKTKIHFRIILSILYLLIPILKYGLQPTALSLFDPSEKHSAISKMSIGIHYTIQRAIYNVYGTSDDRIWVGTVSIFVISTPKIQT